MKTSKEYRAIAREALKGKWRQMCLLMLAAGLLANKFGLDAVYDTYFTVEKMVLGKAFRFPVGFGWALAAAILLMSAMNWLGMIGRYAVSGDVLQGKAPALRRLFQMKLFWKALAMNIVRYILVGLQMLLLIVPGLIAWYRYSMADYILAENPEKGPLQALKESRLRMKDRKWDLACLDFSFFGWALLASVPQFILAGIPGPGWNFVRIICGVLASCAMTAYSHMARTIFFRDAIYENEAHKR